ncbi:hypothetical protein [Legionella shakespearei]|uniref:Uncharacterized protein n=1 Tax=Legionella shakespearei DSM 23087 TaxID=1122169 RepID=A0A0W0YKH4_9GAMM|nr:hypothetical protein [Legionella shakespearei]KTD57420.1 hypothetical protein Lsha_2571 [Legionella shakespearei DSM 23087]
MKSPVEQLLKSPISFKQMSKPVIGEDLHVYDETDVQKLRGRNSYYTSPVSREQCKDSSFPVSFVALKQFILNPVPVNLRDLAWCPITRTLMDHAVIVLVNYEDLLGKSHKFVMICDESALDDVPSDFEILKKKKWNMLDDCLKDAKLRGQIEKTMNQAEPSEATPDDLWQSAFLNAAVKFPKAEIEKPVESTPVYTSPARNDYSFMRAAPSQPDYSYRSSYFSGG